MLLPGQVTPKLRFKCSEALADMHCCGCCDSDVEYVNLMHCVCMFFSEVSHCEEGDEGNEGGSQYKSGWHWRMQRTFANTIPGSHAGREHFRPLKLPQASVLVVMLYSPQASFAMLMHLRPLRCLMICLTSACHAA